MQNYNRGGGGGGEPLSPLRNAEVREWGMALLETSRICSLGQVPPNRSCGLGWRNTAAASCSPSGEVVSK